MDAAETNTGSLTFSKFLSYAGPWALLAFLVGFAVLVLAVRAARRRGPRRHALALFAAAWLPLLPVLLTETLFASWTFVAMTLRWSDPGAAQIAPFLPQRPPPSATALLCSIGLLLALSAAALALARSRPDAPSPA